MCSPAEDIVMGGGLKVEGDSNGTLPQFTENIVLGQGLKVEGDSSDTLQHFTPTENIVMAECLEVEGDTSDTLPQTEMHMSNFLNGSNFGTKNENDMSVCNVN